MRDVDGVEVGLDSGRLAVTDIEDVEQVGTGEEKTMIDCDANDVSCIKIITLEQQKQVSQYDREYYYY